MNLYQNELYMEDLRYVSELPLPWEKLKNRSVMISGATGLVGSFLIDVLMLKNRTGLNCTVYALTRNIENAEYRFSEWDQTSNLIFIAADIKNPLRTNGIATVNYILHMASNTHPVQYATDPIGTITTNVLGLLHLLNFAGEHGTSRFAFISSNEIYGENRGDTEIFDEEYCGYINSNTLRAGYPESKRCGEALCQAYRSQYGMEIIIPRLTRSYGPTMLKSDTKAVSQFILKGVASEDIVLKSEGNQYFSYTYVADAVSGLLFALLMGEDGEAYNIADEKSDIRLKDLAKIAADYSGRRVVFELPDSIESTGYSKATKARLNGSKLKKLGWKAKYDIQEGMKRTMTILKQTEE